MFPVNFIAVDRSKLYSFTGEQRLPGSCHAWFIGKVENPLCGPVRVHLKVIDRGEIQRE